MMREWREGRRNAILRPYRRVTLIQLRITDCRDGRHFT